MRNLGQMMQKAQEVQRNLEEMQKALEQAEVQGQSGGGMVQITLSGKGYARKVTLDPKIIDPADPTMLEDLMLAAINDARAKVDAHVETETKRIMGGVQLPAGLKLPF